LNNKKNIYAVLNAIKHNNISEFSKCPCGSYKKVRKCHLNEINILKKLILKMLILIILDKIF